MSFKIEVPCVPLCELTFSDPSDPENKAKFVTKLADFDQLVRLFQAIDHTYPVDQSAEPQVADFDAIGARVEAYREVIDGLTAYGPTPGQPVPPQTEGYLRNLRHQLYLEWASRHTEQKKTAAEAIPPGVGSGSWSSEESPCPPSSDATHPDGPAGESTLPGTCSPA